MENWAKLKTQLLSRRRQTAFDAIGADKGRPMETVAEMATAHRPCKPAALGKDASGRRAGRKSAGKPMKHGANNGRHGKNIVLIRQ